MALTLASNANAEQVPTAKSDDLLSRAQKVRARPLIQNCLALPDVRIGRNSRFRPNQVEVLLNQSQEILERIVRETSIYNDLRARSVETSSEAYGQLKEVELLEQRLAHGEHLLAANAMNQEYVANSYYSTGTGSDPSATKSGVLNHYLSAQSDAHKQNATITRDSLVAQRFLADLEFTLKDNLNLALQTKVALAKADATRFESTVEYLRKVVDQKYAAMQDSGPLDFQARFEDMEIQILEDWYDVQSRLEVVVLGLQRYFGYGLNNEPGLPVAEVRTPGALATWVRSAVSWMVAFMHRDQSLTEIISLRECVGNWDHKVRDLFTDGSCSITFPWNGGEFQHLAFVRGIGISGNTVGIPEVLIQARVRPPSSSFTVTHDGKILPIPDQSLPPCFLGRIESNNSNRIPEVGGTVSIRNFSPLGGDGEAGTWEVDLVLKSPPPPTYTNFDLRLEVGANAQQRA